MKFINFILFSVVSLTFFSCSEGSSNNSHSQVSGREELGESNLSDYEIELLNTRSWCNKKEYEYSNSGCFFEESKKVSFDLESSEQTYMITETLDSSSINPEDMFTMIGQDGYEFSVRCGNGYFANNDLAYTEIEQIDDSRVFWRYSVDPETGDRVEESQFAVSKVSNEQLVVIFRDETVTYEPCALEE